MNKPRDHESLSVTHQLIDFDIPTPLLFNSLISIIVDYPRDYNVLQTVTLNINQRKSVCIECKYEVNSG